MDKKKKIEMYENKPTYEFEMKEYFKDNPYFGGYSNDYNCPKLKPNKFYVILMKDEKSLSGHYCAILCDENKYEARKCLYIDPYGLPPDTVILKRMRSYTYNPYFSDFQYQKLTSQRCGLYVKYVIARWCEGLTYDQILDELNNVAENKE